MANIDKELNQIKNAVYGREVRGSIHDGIEKINNESEDSKQKANEAHDVMESIINDGFDNAALEANFEQKLDDKINNLQPEWTQFKEQTSQQLAQTENSLLGSVNELEIDNAIHNWWIYPVATRFSDLKNKTYFSRVSNTGGVRVASIDHDTDEYEESLLGTVSADDHNTASILAPTKGTIQPFMIFWTGHNDNNRVFYKKSKDHESIAELGDTTTITMSGIVSYVQVFRKNNTIISFSRIMPDRKWVYIVSTDNGDTWSNERVFLEAGPNFNWPYMICQQRASSDDHIRIAVGEHPHTGKKHNIYFVTLHIPTGEVRKSNPGSSTTVIGNIYDDGDLSFRPDDFTLMYEAEETEKTRLLGIGGGRQVEIAIVSYSNRNDGRYKYIYYDDGPNVVDLIDTGEPIEQPGENNFYFGGMTFSGTDENGILYVTRENDGEWFLEQWQTKNNGATWNIRTLKKSKDNKLFRPLNVFRGTKYNIIYVEGQYTTFRNFDTKINVMEINHKQDASYYNDHQKEANTPNYRIGSNSDGHYRLWDDGTLECWNLLNLNFDAEQRVRGNWTYPVEPVEVYAITGNPGSTSNITPNARELSYNQLINDGHRAIVYQYRQEGMTDFTEGDTLPCYVQMVGRWR